LIGVLRSIIETHFTARWSDSASMRSDAHDDLAELARTFAALGHPLRLQLLLAFDEHSMSPTQLNRRGGSPTPLGLVAYHVRRMVAAGLLELDELVAVRGSAEHFYRLTDRGYAARELLRYARSPPAEAPSAHRP
jgi:DNA-binding transcriptional ArsR family regulator